MLVVMVALAALALTACTDEASDGGGESAPQGTSAPQAGGVTGRPVKVAFSAPGADHGWLKAITDNARKAAEELEVDLVLSEGTNDSASQVSQVETLISQKPDVLVILPHEGGPLTPIAQQAMQAGIPVVNIDREFSTPAAFRTWIGGDNYGIGKAAADFIAKELNCQGNVVEIQGVAGISVTEQRTKGFTDGIKQCNGGIKIVASQPADFLPDKGLQVMETMLQGQKDIDAVYTHDDDMAMGAVQAIRNAGRAGRDVHHRRRRVQGRDEPHRRGRPVPGHLPLQPLDVGLGGLPRQADRRAQGPHRAGRARGPQPHRAARHHRHQGERRLGPEPGLLS